MNNYTTLVISRNGKNKQLTLLSQLFFTKMATTELLNFTQLPGDLTEYLEHLTVNTKVATVLGSSSASPDIQGGIGGAVHKTLRPKWLLIP
jgi:hypothetical protein